MRSCETCIVFCGIETNIGFRLACLPELFRVPDGDSWPLSRRMYCNHGSLVFLFVHTCILFVKCSSNGYLQYIVYIYLYEYVICTLNGLFQSIALITIYILQGESFML